MRDSPPVGSTRSVDDLDPGQDQLIVMSLLAQPETVSYGVSAFFRGRQKV
jgi:hypothetical protein